MEGSGQAVPIRWPIFICYRQADGKVAAARIFGLLHERAVPTAQDGTDPPVLDVYFDQAAPGVGDFTTVHESFLKRARAMIVICTPGAKLNEGPGDWVHREIDWWLANREIAPILVDPLGADLRYVPDAIARKWPNAQRIRMIEADWDRLAEADRAALDDRIRNQFLGAIVPSSDMFYRQELEQDRARTARLQRVRWSLAALVAVLVLVLGGAVWIYNLRTISEAARIEAEAARAEAVAARDAEAAAKELVRARAIEGQAARALIEAGLIDVLEGFGSLDAYKPEFEQWEAGFREQAEELFRTARTVLPPCEDIASFLVAEGQLLSFPLEGLPEQEHMYAFLAKVPGSSPDPGDWFPAVLEIFITDRDRVRPGREVNGQSLMRDLKDAGVSSRWSLLIGLSAPHVLTHRDQTYRIRSRAISMDDWGDMKMSFDICRENVAVSSAD